jgi:hypothetical protein
MDPYRARIDPTAAWTACGATKPAQTIQTLPSATDQSDTEAPEAEAHYQTGDLLFHADFDTIVRYVTDIDSSTALVMDESRERLIRAHRCHLSPLL